MQFGIVVYEGRKRIRLQVRRQESSSQLETFEVIARNKTLMIQSNRPLLRNKGIKYRKPDYKLKSGMIQSLSGLQKIIDVIHEWVRWAEKNGKI